MRLALALGKFPGEIDMMPHADYLEFQEFYGVEPFGSAVLDVAQAHLASLLANINRDTKAHKEPYRVDEFLLFDRPEAKEAEPVLFDDVDAQSNALMELMFRGVKVNHASGA